MFIFLLSFSIFDLAESDTCGQNKKVLGDWFVEHGSPSLLLHPAPKYVGPVLQDPYENPNNPPYDPATRGVCAMQWSNQTDRRGYNKYSLRNFENEHKAMSSNYVVTHQGHCGACSYLQDLGVYLRQNLSDSTKFCSLLSIISPDLMRNCLLDLGLTRQCASIWEWNINNTRKKCFKVCILSVLLGEPNNKPDGSLSDCLQCDEDVSIPNFKFFSGRIRRNSGIISAIARPAGQIYSMEHCYWYGNLDRGKPHGNLYQEKPHGNLYQEKPQGNLYQEKPHGNLYQEKPHGNLYRWKPHSSYG